MLQRRNLFFMVIFAIASYMGAQGAQPSVQPQFDAKAFSEWLSLHKKKDESLKAMQIVRTMQVIKTFKRPLFYTFPAQDQMRLDQENNKRRDLLVGLIDQINFPHELLIDKAFETKDREIIKDTFYILFDLEMKGRYKLSLPALDRAITFDDVDVVREMLYTPFVNVDLLNEAAIRARYESAVKRPCSQPVVEMFELRLKEFADVRAQNLLIAQQRAKQQSMHTQPAQPVQLLTAAACQSIAVPSAASVRSYSDLKPSAKPFVPTAATAAAPAANLASTEKRSRFAFAWDETATAAAKK